MSETNTLEWGFHRTLCSDVNQLLWVGWPHMVAVCSALLQLHAGPTPPRLHAGHMPSVRTVTKWPHMRSVWSPSSVCRSPLPANQKQEPSRSGPVEGGWRSPGRPLTSFEPQLLISNKPWFCIKAKAVCEVGKAHQPVMNIHTYDIKNKATQGKVKKFYSE